MLLYILKNENVGSYVLTPIESLSGNHIRKLGSVPKVRTPPVARFFLNLIAVQAILLFPLSAEPNSYSTAENLSMHCYVGRVRLFSPNFAL